jgi:hypothetical protein
VWDGEVALEGGQKSCGGGCGPWGDEDRGAPDGDADSSRGADIAAGVERTVI